MATQMTPSEQWDEEIEWRAENDPILASEHVPWFTLDVADRTWEWQCQCGDYGTGYRSKGQAQSAWLYAH